MTTAENLWAQRLGLITHSVVIEIDYRNRNHEYSTTPRSEQSRLSWKGAYESLG